MDTFIVVQVHWDHHVNMGVFSEVHLANAYKGYLEEQLPVYSYDIEPFQLNYAPTV